MATLPPIIQGALNLSQGSRQYAQGAIGDDDMRALLAQQTMNVTGQTQAPANTVDNFNLNNYESPPTAQQPTGPQFEKSISDFSADEQRLINDISNQMGLARAPGGIINGQIVDTSGNPIPGAPSVSEFGDIMAGVQSGSMQIGDVARRTNVQGQPIGTPQTGLIGSEQALTGGLQGATDAMLTGAGMARDDITGAGQTAQQQLGAGRGQVIDAALTANNMAQQGLQQGRADIGGIADRTFAAGASPLNPFLQQGQQAAQLQAAQSGALGSQAQQQAYQNFNESPGQQFLREQAELGTTRNAAAIGGLGGGRVRQELQRQAMGLAQQDFGNQFNRLGQVAGQGLQAGGQISGLAGQIGSNLMSGAGSLAGTGAGITGSLGGQAIGQLGSSQMLGAQLAQQQGQNLGNIAQQTGFGIGQNMMGTGQQIAGDRLLTGQQMASNIGGTSTQLANLAAQYGMSVSDFLGATGGNIANLLSGTGQQVATGQQNLGTTLGNIAVGQGSQAVGLPGIPGVQQTPNTLTPALGALGGLMTGGAALMAPTAIASSVA